MNLLKIIMVKIMSKNKVIIYTTIVALILIIGIPTIYKVIKNHNAKLYEVTEKRIIEAAKKCWNESKCQTDTITLKELYELDYLEKEANPVTKKYYSENSKIIKKEEIKFYPE